MRRPLASNRGVQVLNTWISKVLRRPKICQPWRHHVLESGVFDGLLGTERIEDRPTLHVNDRVMAVLSNRCSGKSQHVPCFDLAHDLIERESGQMMALIDNYLAVLSYEVLYLALRCRL